MKSIMGMYDGEKIVPLEPLPGTRKYKVIITFTEEMEPAVQDEGGVRDLHLSATGFDFWADEQEDVYQDFVPQSNPA